ncbi:MAG TPA: toll/interleukin-1 receptor domain-containing protein [Ktedonobacterales bacterium]|jgi:outer membrane protein assembly factor BamB|nr:toll/interleukin-1 receptor domain-containing protein [Ktedonobacterales bacterium]
MFGNGKVFVSHTHEDNAACAPVLAALDAWQVDYWFDLAQLSAGLELLEHIQRGLQDRDIFIRICTPAALASRWTAEEQTLARTMRAPNRGLRRMINLIVKPGYIVQPDEANDITIDATRQPEVVWMRQLREALEISSRERRVSRRAVLGVGITSLAALGGLGLAGKLLFFTPPEPNRYLPIGHQPTATPLPGTSRIRWRFSIYPQPLGTRTSVALAGQTVITAGNSTLTAINGTDGKFLWIQRQYDINTDVPPLVVGDSIYAIYLDKTFPTQDSETDKVYLAAFGVADGSLQQKQLVDTIPVNPLDSASNSAITMDTDATTAYVRVNQTLYACDMKAGKVRWSQGAGMAKVDLHEVLPAPTVAGDAVYAVLGDHKLHAFAATSGAPLWPAPFATELPIRTQPVVANGLVYSGADGGWCYALDAATGTMRWKTQLIKLAPELEDEVKRFTSLGLALHEKVLYISGGFPFDRLGAEETIHFTAIQALDPATGKILWSSSPNKQLNLKNSSLFRTSPVVAGNSIFMTSALYASDSTSTTILYALNPQDGNVKWNLQVPGVSLTFTDNDGVPSAPVVSGDALYLISGNEMLYALSYGDNG